VERIFNFRNSPTEMKLFRKSSNSTSSVPKPEQIPSSRVIHRGPEEERKILFTFLCCKRNSVVENNVERFGLGDNGKEFALISVAPKHHAPTSIHTEQNLTEPLNLNKSNIVMTENNEQQTIMQIDTMEAKPLKQQHRSVLPFGRVKSTDVVSTREKNRENTLADAFPMERQGFSLISFRRNRVPRLDEDMEKIYSDVGSEYALIKVVSKLDQQHDK
jgi:hypothetical protein